MCRRCVILLLVVGVVARAAVVFFSLHGALPQRRRCTSRELGRLRKTSGPTAWLATAAALFRSTPASASAPLYFGVCFPFRLFATGGVVARCWKFFLFILLLFHTVLSRLFILQIYRFVINIFHFWVDFSQNY